MTWKLEHQGHLKDDESSSETGWGYDVLGRAGLWCQGQSLSPYLKFEGTHHLCPWVSFLQSGHYKVFRKTRNATETRVRSRSWEWTEFTDAELLPQRLACTGWAVRREHHAQWQTPLLLSDGHNRLTVTTNAGRKNTQGLLGLQELETFWEEERDLLMPTSLCLANFHLESKLWRKINVHLELYAPCHKYSLRLKQMKKKKKTGRFYHPRTH